MNIDILSSEYITLILVPILIGVLEVIKRSEIINSKSIPIVSLILGVLLGIVFSGFDIKDGILAGLFIGLSAVGLYSGTINVVDGLKNK